MEIQTLLESPGPFKTWLESKKPSVVVGVRNGWMKCPFARFLRELGAVSYVCVGPNRVHFRKQEGEALQSLDLYEWTRRLIPLIDEDSPHNGVRAKTALRFLQTALATAA